ncbi:hypothetical protein JAAARDRAFT_128211 [Jaapia argillacea MUCL 33604]|uniref:RNA-directed DNA polymerase n=1 Tax=Jaapia argillacea MUCL 33604 TaxID=933084 RepID=A0A067PZK8_9AGAM|nr:hypothetical protein JAAARDRAFT_128211 [Jaapia argillacea MUCL 33604]
MKMHHYLRSWGINIGQSTPFIRNTIRQMITFTFATIRNKASNKVARASNGRCDVEKSSVCWLGMHAFHTVLTRKPHAYLKLIKSFEFDLSLPQYRRCRRRFRNVVKDGLGLMTVLGY